MRSAVLTLVAAAIAVAAQPVTAARAAPRTTAVVADISPGVNPYHVAFRRPGWTDSPARHVAGFPATARRLDLTLGRDYATSRAADAKKWAAYRPGVVHWVPGTNLLLLTVRSPGFLPDGDPAPGSGGLGGGALPRLGHGTATAGAVATACRDCYVLVVQDAASVDGRPVRDIARSLPWVDLVVSTNYPGEPGAALAGAYADATRELHSSGRSFVAATGNTPVAAVMPLPYPQVALPPWVVLTGGAHETCRAAEAQAGKPAEFVGEYSQLLPSPGTVDGTVASHGTSFAAPQVAGRFGRALVTVRRAKGSGRAAGALWAGRPDSRSPYLADGRLTHTELRAAMAGAARYFATADFRGTGLCATPVPVSPTPWVEMGWGYVADGDAALAAQVLLGRAEPPGKPAAATAYLDAIMAVRSAVYD